MRTALGYVRISTDEQADRGLGLEAQRQRVRAYCEMKGLHLAEVCEDPGVSGGKPLGSRLAGNRLVARSGRCRSVVAGTRLDRLFRSVADAAQTIADFDRRGIQLVAIAEGFDMTNPHGRDPASRNEGALATRLMSEFKDWCNQQGLAATLEEAEKEAALLEAADELEDSFGELAAEGKAQSICVPKADGTIERRWSLTSKEKTPPQLQPDTWDCNYLGVVDDRSPLAALTISSALGAVSECSDI